MRKTFRTIAALCVGFSAACQDATRPTEPTAVAPGSIIQDGWHNQGNPHFFFLPPTVPSTSFSGTFDPTQQPVVEICELAGSACAAPALARFTLSPGADDVSPDDDQGERPEYIKVSPRRQFYRVRWETDEYNLDPTKTYRITVSVDGQQLGFADVDVVLNKRQARNVNTGEYIPLVNGRTLPIKFRIEQGALALSGIWTGTQDYDDPSFGQPATWALRVNFDSMTARNSACLNPGTVTSVTPVQIQVDFVGCGLEVVNYARSGNSLDATGTVTAYSGGRVIPSIWHLTTTPPLLAGIWTGTVTLDDPATSSHGTYSLQINFGTGTAVTGMCGNAGTVTVVTPTLIGITYPDCGLETATYSVSTSTMTASGLLVALSDGRVITTAWQLTEGP